MDVINFNKIVDYYINVIVKLRKELKLRKAFPLEDRIIDYDLEYSIIPIERLFNIIILHTSKQAVTNIIMHYIEYEY